MCEIAYKGLCAWEEAWRRLGEESMLPFHGNENSTKERSYSQNSKGLTWDISLRGLRSHHLSSSFQPLDRAKRIQLGCHLLIKVVRTGQKKPVFVLDMCRFFLTVISYRTQYSTHLRYMDNVLNIVNCLETKMHRKICIVYV